MSWLSEGWDYITGGDLADEAGYGRYEANQYKINAKAFGMTPGQLANRNYATQKGYETQKRAAPTMGAAQVDQSQQNQFRNQEMALAGQLAQQASGLGPSLAQNQLRDATNRNIAQQMALAASQRGGANPLAARQVAQNIAAQNQQLAGQSADLRMQEQMAARSQLGGLLGQGRSADIGLAQNQAALNQQAAMQNQQARLQQTGLNDAQTRFYEQSRFDADNQDQQNRMALEQLRVNQNLGIEGINSGAFQAQQTGKQGLVGGLIGGAAAAFGMADGGVVPEAPDLAKATAQAEEPKKKGFKDVAKNIAQGFSAASSSPQSGSYQTGQALGKGVGLGVKKLFSPSSNPAPKGAMAGEAAPLAAGAMLANEGGKVPGRARVMGDSTKNDKVPAFLSPGEVVVPRSVVQEGPKAVSDFVAHVMKENKKRRSDDELFKLAYGGRAC